MSLSAPAYFNQLGSDVARDLLEDELAEAVAVARRGLEVGDPDLRGIVSGERTNLAVDPVLEAVDGLLDDVGLLRDRLEAPGVAAVAERPRIDGLDVAELPEESAAAERDLSVDHRSQADERAVNGVELKNDGDA